MSKMSSCNAACIIHIIDACVAGNLNIAAVTQEDIDERKSWKCCINNPILNMKSGGSETRIISSGLSSGKIFCVFREQFAIHVTVTPCNTRIFLAAFNI